LREKDASFRSARFQGGKRIYFQRTIRLRPRDSWADAFPGFTRKQVQRLAEKARHEHVRLDKLAERIDELRGSPLVSQLLGEARIGRVAKAEKRRKRKSEAKQLIPRNSLLYRNPWGVGDQLHKIRQASDLLGRFAKEISAVMREVDARILPAHTDVLKNLYLSIYDLTGRFCDEDLRLILEDTIPNPRFRPKPNDPYAQQWEADSLSDWRQDHGLTKAALSRQRG
jgi:hypothetical protein